MPFQILKSNQNLPPVDVLVRFKPARGANAFKRRFRARPEGTPQADVRVIPSPREGVPSKYIYSTRKPASWEEVVACYREIFDAIPRHGWTSVAVPLCPSMVTPHEVYRIACSEIRRALDERDMQIVLLVDDIHSMFLAENLFLPVQKYIQQRFKGGESGQESPYRKEQTLPALSAAEAEIAAEETPEPDEETPVQLSLSDCFVELEDEAPSSSEAWEDYGESYFAVDEDMSPAEDDGGSPCAEPSLSLESADNAISKPRPDGDVESAGSTSWLTKEQTAMDAALYGTLPMYSMVRARRSTAKKLSIFSEVDRIVLDESFSQAVLRLIQEKGLTDPQCYSRANLSRAVFNKLKQSALNPEKVSYKPSKSTALALAIALELDIDEAKDLLQKAGFALSHSSKGDIIVEYFLENHLYDIFELNEILFKFGEPLLGSL